MLFRVDPNQGTAERRFGERLAQYGLDERGFQQILFRHLDDLIPEDELFVISQSKPWGEEPDLLALDQHGRLFIFELKVGEGEPENLLQVLRYGQIFGQYEYDRLDRLYRRAPQRAAELKVSHAQSFGLAEPLDETQFNEQQVFVTLTNGIQDRTRAAANYWSAQGLDVRPWTYLVYAAGDGLFDIELRPFRVGRHEQPTQDLPASFHIINTNRVHSEQDHEQMLARGEAAAFYSPWKFHIDALQKRDHVFLYSSGEGIVAYGTAAADRPEVRDYHGDPEAADEEYVMPLRGFHHVDPPLTAAEIKEIAGQEIVFRSTRIPLASEVGKRVLRAAEERAQSPDHEPSDVPTT